MKSRASLTRSTLPWAWLMTAGLMAVGNAVAEAEVPVITNPADIHFLDSNTAFDPLGSNTWAIKAPMPTGRAGAATAATSDKVYVIGGEVVDSCTTVPVVEAYDPVTDQWITGLSPLPAPNRWRPSAGTLDGVIYVLGGESTGDLCGDVLDLVQAYDPVADSWSDKASILTPRLQIGAGVDPINHLLYAVGGSTAGPEFQALKNVEVYDPTTDTWTPKHDLNTARGFPAVAVIGGKVYAIGGQDSRHTTINTVEVYDPLTDTWTTTPSLIPFPRLNSTSAVIDDKVYVVGGEAGGLLSSLQIYDPTRDCDLCGKEAWTTGVSMPTARTFLGAAEVNGVLYALGGEANLAQVGQEFTYQITATNNPTSYDASPLPDGLSVNKLRGIISGVPTTTVRDFHVSFSATNDSGQGPPKDVSLFIAPRDVLPDVLSFVNSTCVTGRAGEPFSFQVITDGASPIAQIAATGLPYKEGVGPELTIDPGTGVISGTMPSADDGSAQSFGVTLNVADGPTTTQSFLELTFVSDPTAPVITSPSSRTLTLNQFFSYTITADAPADSFDYIGLDGLLNGALPPGLSYNPATATISGIYGGDQLSSQISPNAHKARPFIIGDPDTIKKEPPPHIQLLANNNLGGAGIAPLNFLLSLQDFESEALKDTTSQGTSYVIFTNDPEASGQSAGLLEATQAGEFVSYIIPKVPAGTYDIRVGTKRDKNVGIFQLMIDGRNQGPVEDEYSTTPAYEARDLGTITFGQNGNRTFTFLIVGKNANSDGYELVVDYIDLIPHPEAEALVVQGSSAPYENKRDPNLSGGAGTIFKATRVGDYLTYTLPVMTAGTYDINVGTTTDTNRGIFQLSIDGANQGYTQNEFASTTVYNTRDLGTVNFATAGDKTLTFSVTGKDPSSTGYQLLFDYISLTLSTHLEAEALDAHATARLSHISDQNLSGGSGVLLHATKTGQYLNYTVNIPVAGTYHLKLGTRTANNCGTFQLEVDGRDQGLPQDEYSASTGYAVLDLGLITFTQPGDKAFRFTVTGKNPNSLGYQLSFDYLDLVR